MNSQESQKQQYLKNYEEFNLLGRGNYGAAYLVKNRIDGNHYVAKKMMLEGMPEKEVVSAWGEIQILKKFSDLNIPFIVEYKECFHFERTLIIVMEYCEHGDLTVFLKSWKKRGELLDERIVVNWFIQLLFGVKTLHSKNVLHRDLKSANIFLTSNKTLKIGDFGISKVLDNTSAKTFVGTPYYLSPEVCENRPYSLSSDLWSLGCILYELCTLAYPFQASNLLGLAMKILTDEVKPIPEKYSPELNQIVMGLFTKDEKKRMTIDDILKSPYIKRHMETFVEDQVNINKLIQIGKMKLKPQEEEQKPEPQGSDDNEDTMKTINSVMEGTSKQDTLSYSQTLTPKERMLLKKEEEVRRRQEELKQASLSNNTLRNFAKERKFDTLAGSGSNFNKSTLEKQFQQENKEKADLARTRGQLQKMQVIDTEQLSETLNQMRTMKAKAAQFEEVELPEDVGNLTIKSTVPTGDDRPIRSKQQYKIEEEIEEYEELEEYYDDQFEDYIEEPQLKSTATKEEFEEIKAFYENAIGHGISPSKKSRVQEAFKSEEISGNLTPEAKISGKAKECKQLVGEQTYKALYAKVKNQKINYNNIKQEYTPEEIKAIKIIDEIIYYESF